ncbi:zinc-binding dehydrogenase [Actinosynnema sp. NPDC020468]|uniref:zinc-binding dehydrogenase n=1 Tax=Actinosynnema sp. NPDC020468 TaxID=3154488 RepID=UPI0033D16F7F
MRAVRLHGFGGPDGLRHEEVADPEPGPGRVRIAVRAAGVRWADTAVRRGEAPWALPDLPAVPGGEVAGVVDAVGPGVPGTWSGARVVTQLGWAGGGYAELVVREVDALHLVPDGVGFAAAVAMVGTGAAALGVLAASGVGAGDVVLVTAAAGAVGNLVVQGASRRGARVVGAVGHAAKRGAALRAGAVLAVDYRREGWVDEVRAAVGEVDVVSDGVGGVVGRAAVDLVCAGGRVVLHGASSGALTTLSTEDLFARSLTVSAGPVCRAGTRVWERRALAAVAAGELRPVLREFALADAAAAHAALEARATVGKVVLVPAAG